MIVILRVDMMPDSELLWHGMMHDSEILWYVILPHSQLVWYRNNNFITFIIIEIQSTPPPTTTLPPPPTTTTIVTTMDALLQYCIEILSDWPVMGKYYRVTLSNKNSLVTLITLCIIMNY